MGPLLSVPLSAPLSAPKSPSHLPPNPSKEVVRLSTNAEAGTADGDGEAMAVPWIIPGEFR